MTDETDSRWPGTGGSAGRGSAPVTGTDRGRSLLGSLFRFALAAGLVAVTVATLLPGGPTDPAVLDGLGGPQAASDDVATEPDGRSTAGTTPTDAAERPTGPSPWEKEVLVVTVRNRADPDRDVAGAVAEALAYWERNSGYADYPASFHLQADATDPDVVVWYNGSIDCPRHADAIGCAPLIDGASRVDPPVSVQLQYDPADNRRQVRNTAIHEFGHVLGITHCEEPAWVMAPACSEPVPDAPDATARDLAWRDATISLYVDDSNVPADEREQTREQVAHALAFLEEADAETFPADVEFVRVDDRFEADVTVAFPDRTDCGSEAVVCYRHRGRDFDGDGRMEYHANGAVQVTPASDVAARGWYVGRGLAHVLSPGNVPAVFEEASYRERRSRWWE